MGSERIFIASASEAKDLVSKIAQTLAAKGFSPIRWWDAFPPSGYTLERLIHISDSVDAAIVVCTGEDKLWYRGEVATALRDNVVLEYGLFVSKLGIKKTLFLKDKPSKLPSDMTGLSFGQIIDDPTTVAEVAASHMENVLRADLTVEPIDGISIVAHPGISFVCLNEPLPREWRQRALYIRGGARRWLALAKDRDYISTETSRSINAMLLRAAQHAEVHTIVSLGPGDGETDFEIVTHIKNRQPSLRYIPVDISDSLLQTAIRKVAEQVYVPIGILADFEEHLAFINRKIKQFGRGPILFSLLGNTLGNLDRFERAFVGTLRTMMRHSDMLLIDISLAGSEWSIGQDRRGVVDSYVGPNRTFIASAIARKTGESFEAIDFAKRIRVSEAISDSDVPNSKTIKLIDKGVDGASGAGQVLSIRRYDWESVKMWFQQQGFDSIYDEKIWADGVSGDGVLLLRRSRQSVVTVHGPAKPGREM